MTSFSLFLTMALSVNNEPDKSRAALEGLLYGKQRIFILLQVKEKVMILIGMMMGFS
jgi:hypothetical protein